MLFVMRIYPNLFFVLLYFVCFSSYGQANTIKYGKVELPDLQMMVYPKDSSAEAVVLGDICSAYFVYSSAIGFQIIYERHRRVKIFKKSGYDWANIKVPLYRSSKGRGEEDLYDLKGFTYNLENGQIIKDKLEKESIFLENVDESHSTQKIVFPKVKEGSIIEYSYKIKSDFYYNFKDWIFQSSIPVAWSEFSVSVPEYFSYRQIMQGYEPIHINTMGNGEASFSIKIEAEKSGNGYQTTYSPPSIQKITALTKEYRWAMKDIPALRKEPYMTTIDDYVSKIQFELSSLFFPGSPIKNYAENWGSINARLIESEFFGQQLNRSGFLKGIVSTIKASSKDTLTQIEMGFQFIKKNMNWNQKEAIYVGTSIENAFESKKGNTADINLMLVMLLRELGFEANPVIISTRDNGRILDNYVLLSKFNYVIAHVNIEGKDLLLDATTTNTPIGILPLKCLNGQGRLISKAQTRWVNLSSPYKYAETTAGSFELTSEGTVKGNLTNSYAGYNSINERIKYYQEGKEKYLGSYKQKNANWLIEKISLENVETIATPFIRKQEITINDFSTIAGNRIYFNPIIYNAQKINPFKNPDRKFPVDFGTLIDENFVATYTIPQGYLIEEIPKSIRVNLPEDGGRFTYAVSASEDGKITVSSKISLKKTMYLIEEYETLRTFYNQIIQKHAEQIVLKKK